MSWPVSASWCFTLLVMLRFIAGCGHSYDRQVMTSSKTWPPTDEIRVFRGSAPGSFEIVGFIQSIRHDRKSTSSTASVINALIDQAKSKGCNAISHVRIDVGSNRQFAHGYAVCVRRHSVSDS